MSRISKKFVRLGTAAGELNARDVPANFTPTNYTPAQIAAEGNDKISAHLNGIDAAITGSGVAGDISLTSFSAANNQSSAANVTGFAFANGVTRAFKALVSVSLDATADLFEQFEIQGIQKSASWEISVSSVGDTSGVVFSITSGGQIQYVSANSAGFVSNTIKFRADTLTL